MKLGRHARSFGEGIYPDEAAFPAVVRQVGELGFGGVEADWKKIEGYLDRPAEFPRTLSGFGVAFVRPHYGGALWDLSARDETAADLRRIAPFVSAVSGSFVICSSNRPEGKYLMPDTPMKMAERLTELGSVCATHGSRLAYHNHCWEAQEGVLKRLAELTNPREVSFAFDTEAAALGLGQLNLDVAGKTFREIGYGGWVIVEEESKPPDPYENARQCMGILRCFGG